MSLSLQTIKRFNCVCSAQRKTTIMQKEKGKSEETFINIQKIGSTCLESYPCQHSCTWLDENGVEHSGLLDGRTIYEAMAAGRSYTKFRHFEMYADNKNFD